MSDLNSRDMRIFEHEADFFELVQNLAETDIPDMSVYLSFKPTTEAQKNFIKSYYESLSAHAKFVESLVKVFENLCKVNNVEYC